MKKPFANSTKNIIRVPNDQKEKFHQRRTGINR